MEENAQVDGHEHRPPSSVAGTHRTVDVENETAVRKFYIVSRFNAFWATVLLIATYVAESVLNTIRLNEKLSNLLLGYSQGSQFLKYFQAFYPEGGKPIEIVASAHVWIYIFAIFFYSLFRIVHHKTLREYRGWPYEGEERKKNLGSLSVFTRWAWLLTPRFGVHQVIMRMWMWWGIIPLLATLALSWLGIRVFTSDNLVTTLVGAGIVFCVNLLEDSRFFRRVPARDVLGRIMLSTLSLPVHKNLNTYWREMTDLVEKIKAGEVEVTKEDIHRIEQMVRHFGAEIVRKEELER